MFKTSDAGKTWSELQACASTAPARAGSPAGGLCLHTIVIDPSNHQRSSLIPRPARSGPTMAARPDADQPGPPLAAFRIESRRRPLRPSHRDAPLAAEHLFVQRQWDDAQRRWRRVVARVRATCRPTSGSQSVHAHEPETIYVVPIKSDLALPPDGRLRVFQQDRRRRHRADQHAAARRYVNVLREAMAVARRDCASTSRLAVGLRPAGRRESVGDARDLPAVVREVQTLARFAPSCRRTDAGASAAGHG